MELISSLHNARVKDAVKLRDGRQRRKQDRLLVDGAREIALALRARVPLVEAFVCPELCHAPESRDVLDRLAETRATLWQVTPEVFAKLAFGKRVEGMLVVAVTPHPTLADLKLADTALVAVVEGIEKPGNIGAVIRSADAAGVSAVIAAGGRTDLFNPNCIRASLGAVFAVPVCEATTEDTLIWLRRQRYQIVAARVDAPRDYAAVDYRARTAIVLGSEADGLSPAWDAPDITAVRLPMRGAVDSLNVSATAAVLFYEALRQRNA